MLSEHRYKNAARRFLRRLIDSAGRKPLRMTTDKHPAYTKAIRWIVGRKVLNHYNRYLNNLIEQDHRSIKQRYYPMLGFAKFESASRFCNAFDEFRNYLRVRSVDGEHVSASSRREIFTERWSTLMTELSA
jgi:transposase-like protein